LPVSDTAAPILINLSSANPTPVKTHPKKANTTSTNNDFRIFYLLFDLNGFNND
jgi:hypothetical protein